MCDCARLQEFCYVHNLRGLCGNPFVSRPERILHYVHVIVDLERFSNLDGFTEVLRRLEFEVIVARDLWKSVWIRAVNTGQTREEAELTF